MTVVPPPVRRRKKADSQKYRIPYHERPFIFWDGEGSHPKHLDGKYILFGCSINGEGYEEIHGEDLHAIQCLELMIEVARKYPNHIHCAFAFNYDVVMILKSLPVEHAVRLKSKGYDFYGPYRLEYRPGKWFAVTHRPSGQSVRINDIFSFFGKSAIASAEEYLPDSEYLSIVRYGKSKRDSFEYANLHLVRTYMHVELRLYVQLIHRLRNLLSELGVKPQGWYGPGAVATAVLRKQKIKSVMDRNLPDAIIEASQQAYFGGRFEQYKTGVYYGQTHSYDVRSAYPNAMRAMPNLQNGIWQHRTFDVTPTNETLLDFALYKVSYSAHDRADWHSPHPFPRRNRNGAIGYPTQVDNWYWGIEVRSAIRSNVGTIDVSEGWEFWETDSSDRPFTFLAHLYDQRQVWKNEGNPVQLAAKLALNSLYGKQAQRVGWNEDTMMPPTWHQLEYAGFTTASCRARVWELMSQAPGRIIAVETDGLYSEVELEVLPDNKQLGDWEHSTADGIMYVQSGMYWTLGHDEKGQREWQKGKTRGFTRKALTLETVKTTVSNLSPIQVTSRRFAGLSYATTGLMSQWIDRESWIEWGGSGKRKHIRENCITCSGRSEIEVRTPGNLTSISGTVTPNSSKQLTDEWLTNWKDRSKSSRTQQNRLESSGQWHQLTLTDFVGGTSWKHVLPWRDTDKHPRWEILTGFEDLEVECDTALETR